jgi:uncharacterized SAM-binding protein YcdF (DUF218 family)
MTEAIKALLVPPGLICLVVTIGLVIALRSRRLGLAVITAGAVLLYLLSMPIVAAAFGHWTQTTPSLTDQSARKSGAQAIVVLSAGSAPFSPEYGGESVDAVTLQRLRYAAHLLRMTGLPILVTGGRGLGDRAPLAWLMKVALEEDFGVPVRWIEPAARNTRENAILSALQLKQAGVTRILLVTHAAHMARAEHAFTAAGLDVVPAPTVFTAPSRTFPADFVPRLSALENTSYALYEWMGGLLYRWTAQRS